ncbi:MAG: aminotransferase class-III, partial [Dactylosporangium sp.]|nr:aminotransferase class-III [Dactylosporangium sp.]
AVATINELRDSDALPRMAEVGQRLRDGLAAQATAHGFVVRQSGPVQMPLLMFDGDTDFQLARVWTREAVTRGVYLHPWHNWFMSAAHTHDDVVDALARTDEAFAALRRHAGQ